jgi:hypothetical protein
LYKGAGFKGDGRGGEPFRAIGGRKLLSSGGDGARWLAIDTWHVIGPFDTNEGASFNRIFPPEQMVDLDATYLGADAKQISWQYVRSPTSVIGVPRLRNWAVYYAWTEIYVDQDIDLWIAIASDDWSKMWMNEQLVFEADYQASKDVKWGFPIEMNTAGTKAYFNHKGFRKVHFSKGLTRFMVRLHNNGGGCAFSLFINTDPKF